MFVNSYGIITAGTRTGTEIGTMGDNWGFLNYDLLNFVKNI